MKDKEIEFYTWADRIVSELKNRNVDKHVVHGMWTPSGYFHIGNSRPEIFTPAIAFEALTKSGLNVTFNLFFDDFDDFDKIPEGIDLDKKTFEKYLGLPLREVPSPNNKYDNWAEFFESQIVEVVEKFGVKPNFISSYDSYKEGKYDAAIKTVLNNYQKALEIWENISGKKPKGIPLLAKCEECGKTLTTLITNYDGTYVEYSCEQEAKGVKGCGHKSKLKPEKGNVKLPWRLHWPATWSIFGTTFESGGKDHFTIGGSVDTGKEFIKEIFGIEPPLLVGTDFLTIDGKKISGSFGNVISMADWLEFAEADLLRFMYISSPPKKTINFDLKTNKFFLLADKFDKAERLYFNAATEKDNKESEKLKEQLKRQYYFSKINLPKKMPLQLSYSYAVLIAQTRDISNEQEVLSVLKNLGFDKLEKDNKENFLNRIKLAKNWIDKYAPEEVKIKINDSIPKIDLKEKEKLAIKQILSKVNNDQTGEELQQLIYDTSKEKDLIQKEFFSLLYKLIIGKEKGPRLGPFILSIGIDKFKSILAQI